MTDLTMFPLALAAQATPLKATLGTVEGVRLTAQGTFIFPSDGEIDAAVIEDFIKLHINHRQAALLENHYMYHGTHRILLDKAVQNSMLVMPDNRLVTNYPKYIVDTFNGYLVGIPVNITNDKDKATDDIQDFIDRTDFNDQFAELSKSCSIYGHAYAYMYQGQDSKTYMQHVNPLEMFVIYDDNIEQNPLAGVRFWEEVKSGKNYIKADVYIGSKKYEYSEETGVGVLSDVKGYENMYPRIPIIEFVENESRQSVFEPVKTLIDAYNKVLSNKMNDIEYFANAYLKILGASIESKTLTSMQANRVINAVGTASQAVDIGFIEKPDSDNMTEHMLDRLTDLIFITSMVANTTDDTYGAASGTALEFKLQDMRNMAIAKQRKLTSGLRQVFRVFASSSLNTTAGIDSWTDNKYNFTENMPRNVKEEVENAKNLEGLVSKGTQLSQLSFVEDVRGEITAMDKEQADNLSMFEAKAKELAGNQQDSDTEPVDKEAKSDDKEDNPDDKAKPDDKKDKPNDKAKKEA